jgi:hypothetical protein
MFYSDRKNADKAARKEYEETGVPVLVHQEKPGRFVLHSVPLNVV